jgi:hypothetical protein
MFVCIYVCMCVWEDWSLHRPMYLCMYICMYVCMARWESLSSYVCVYVYMYVCVYGKIGVFHHPIHVLMYLVPGKIGDFVVQCM